MLATERNITNGNQDRMAVIGAKNSVEPTKKTCRHRGSDDQLVESSNGEPKSGSRNTKYVLCGGSCPYQGSCLAKDKL